MARAEGFGGLWLPLTSMSGVLLSRANNRSCSLSCSPSAAAQAELMPAVALCTATVRAAAYPRTRGRLALTAAHNCFNAIPKQQTWCAPRSSDQRWPTSARAVPSTLKRQQAGAACWRERLRRLAVAWC